MLLLLHTTSNLYCYYYATLFVPGPLCTQQPAAIRAPADRDTNPPKLWHPIDEASATRPGNDDPPIVGPWRWMGSIRSVVPAQEHDDAALDDVEPCPLLLERLAEPPLPPLASNKLHLSLQSLALRVSDWIEHGSLDNRARIYKSCVLLAQVAVDG
ncbi:unnamed protein product [Urochloa humidicola]